MPSILSIPSSDVYTIRGIDNATFFKIVVHTKDTKKEYRDIHTTIAKNQKPVLEVLAKEMNVAAVSKLKKAELVMIVSEHIQFV